MGSVKRLIAAACTVLAVSVAAQAQDPKTQPLLDANAAVEKELASVPHITPEIAKAIVAKRPLKSSSSSTRFSSRRS